MDSDTLAGLVALTWLVVALLVMARSVRRGKALAATLAARHPEFYEKLGRPTPAYFPSARRNRFAQVVARREYEKLGDPALSAQFEAHRKSEARHLLFVVVSLVVVGLFLFVLHRAT